MRKHTISFKNAFIGIITAARTQTNIRIHLAIATLVFILGVIFKISITQALILLLTVGLVVIAEMVNTSIEFFCDAITLEKNENIRHAKDISAGAVLIAAIFSAIIGFIIFVPRIVTIFV